jgi:uncharacterized protein (DUF488 family)
MGKTESKIIWTIGHSTHTIEEFVELLQAFEIKLLADVRSYPGSRRYPQFNKENLANTLHSVGIEYVHLLALGGRRKALPDSINTEWENKSFRGYADYMQTDEFKNGIKELEQFALKQPTVYMCSEAVWWRCHRSMVSDYLKDAGWTVIHIMSLTKSEEHPYTTVARNRQGNLFTE